MQTCFHNTPEDIATFRAKLTEMDTNETCEYLVSIPRTRPLPPNAEALFAAAKQPVLDFIRSLGAAGSITDEYTGSPFFGLRATPDLYLKILNNQSLLATIESFEEEHELDMMLNHPTYSMEQLAKSGVKFTK